MYENLVCALLWLAKGVVIYTLSAEHIRGAVRRIIQSCAAGVNSNEPTNGATTRDADSKESHSIVQEKKEEKAQLSRTFKVLAQRTPQEREVHKAEEVSRELLVAVAANLGIHIENIVSEKVEQRTRELTKEIEQQIEKKNTDNAKGLQGKRFRSGTKRT